MRRTLPNFKFQQSPYINNFYGNAFVFFSLFGALALQLEQIAENKKVISSKYKTANTASFFNDMVQQVAASAAPGFDGFMPEKALTAFKKM